MVCLRKFKEMHTKSLSLILPSSSPFLQPKVTPIRNLSYYWRPIPQVAVCSIKATVPPSPPNRIEENSISVKSTEMGSFNASWTPPSLPHGTITMYEVAVGEIPVEKELDLTTCYIHTVMVRPDHA